VIFRFVSLQNGMIASAQERGGVRADLANPRGRLPPGRYGASREMLDRLGGSGSFPAEEERRRNPARSSLSIDVACGRAGGSERKHLQPSGGLRQLNRLDEGPEGSHAFSGALAGGGRARWPC